MIMRRVDNSPNRNLLHREARESGGKVGTVGRVVKKEGTRVSWRGKFMKRMRESEREGARRGDFHEARSTRARDYAYP